MSTSLADRALVANHHRFVGRTDLCDRFQTALTADDPPFLILHVYGPGGVGKTTLLREFRYICRNHGVPNYVLDGRHLEPNPAAFTAALRNALGLSPDACLAEAFARNPERQTLFVDTFEQIAALEDWLYTDFLPTLTDNVLLVIAGRRRPMSPYAQQQGWQALTHVEPLRNLNPAESRTYLTRANVPPDQHEAVLRFTHGHPLALSLIAEVHVQRPGTPFTPESDPDIIKALLDRLVMKLPSPAHRVTLEACALVHYVTEPLLAAMLNVPDAHKLFSWLRNLAFVEAGCRGLTLHEMTREALAADLRWRNPNWYETLHRRARVHYNHALQHASLDQQKEILADYTYLHRHNPVVRPFIMQLRFMWGDRDHTLQSGTARPKDLPALEAMVHDHEGPASAAHARFWFERHPEHVFVVRDAGGRPVGFLLTLPLDALDPADRDADPGTRAAWNYLTACAPLRAGEHASLFRFWMAAETYQAVSAVQSLLFVKTIHHYITTRALAVTLLPCAYPRFWRPVFAYADLPRLPAADFEVGGRRYGVYGRDWRRSPLAAWLDLLAERQSLVSPLSQAPSPADRPVLVLSEEGFREAVRGALGAYSRPHQLKNSPLLSSRLVLEATSLQADEADRIEALRSLLLEAAESFKEAPRQKKYYWALDRTYFRPAPTQAVAAERLDLPFSTYRRHLKAGIDAVVHRLWAREIDL